MTYFEYIKNEATIEQIAHIFGYLENDSGYYTESNVAAITAVTDKDFDLDRYGHLDDHAELQALELLNSDIDKYKD